MGRRGMVPVLALGVVVTALLAGRPAAAEVAGCSLFPADNAWNVRVDGLPVHPRSADYVASIGPDVGLHPDFGAGTWNGGPIGIPFTTVGGSQPPVPVAFEYAEESDPGPYPVPPDAPIEGGPPADGDRHVLVVDRDRCRLYELYAAYPQEDGSWAAGSGAVWDLRSNALRPATWTSADAAGLPILPGLVRYDEVATGEIRHALRFTAQRTQRAFVWPARHFASSITDPRVPPMGQRFRLRAGFDVSRFPAEVQVILRALQTYGMMLADNGSNWYVSGAPDPRWNDDALVSALRQVRGADFEAVDVSGLIVDPDSGQASATPGASGTTLALHLSQPSLAPGDTLRLELSLHHDGPPVTVDLYLAVRLPDGVTAVFLAGIAPPALQLGSLAGDPRGFPAAARGVTLPAGFAVDRAPVLVHPLTGGEPPGEYAAIAALVRSGALVDGAAGPGDVLALVTQPFTVTSAP